MDNGRKETMPNRYTYISTPSHGYLQVPEADYCESGYRASQFSYQGDGYVYLEEDCDAPQFMDVAIVISSEITSKVIDHDITESLTPMDGVGYVSPFQQRMSY